MSARILLSDLCRPDPAAVSLEVLSPPPPQHQHQHQHQHRRRRPATSRSPSPCHSPSAFGAAQSVLAGGDDHLSLLPPAGSIADADQLGAPRETAPSRRRLGAPATPLRASSASTSSKDVFLTAPVDPRTLEPLPTPPPPLQPSEAASAVSTPRAPAQPSNRPVRVASAPRRGRKPTVEPEPVALSAPPPSGFRSFPCEDCGGKLFRSARELKRHRLADHDERARRWACDGCRRWYSRPYELERHLASNPICASLYPATAAAARAPEAGGWKMGRPRCKECGMWFSRPDIATRHVKRTHGLGPDGWEMNEEGGSRGEGEEEQEEELE